MDQTKRSQYVQAVQEAEGEWDADIQESEMAGMSEAERLADALVRQAPKPRKRKDGLPVAGEHKRSLPFRFAHGICALILPLPLGLGQGRPILSLCRLTHDHRLHFVTDQFNKCSLSPRCELFVLCNKLSTKLFILVQLGFSHVIHTSPKVIHTKSGQNRGSYPQIRG